MAEHEEVASLIRRSRRCFAVACVFTLLELLFLLFVLDSAYNPMVTRPLWPWIGLCFSLGLASVSAAAGVVFAVIAYYRDNFAREQCMLPCLLAVILLVIIGFTGPFN